MRRDFEPRVLPATQVGETLDQVLRNAEGVRLQHWLAAEVCAEDEKKPALDYLKADAEQRRLEAAVAEWKRLHLGEEAA